MPSAARNPVELFISFAHEDEDLRDELTKHLAALKRQGIIRDWHDREIKPGAEWDRVINEHLDSAEIILLLVSPDFMASDYCNDIEVKRALERHEMGEAVVIPVILRPVDWAGAPFQKLQSLPKDAKPVTRWPNTDEALVNVAQGIRRVAQQLAGGSASRATSGEADRRRWELVLSASFGNVDEARVEAVVAHLRQLTGDLSLTLLEVKPGSVRLTLEGTAEAFETIEELFKSGQLIEIEGFKIESVRVVLDTPPSTAFPHLAVKPPRGRAKRVIKTGAGRPQSRSGASPRPPLTKTGERKPKESPTEGAAGGGFPLRVLREAIRAVPAVRYASGVAGVAAAISIVAGFKLNLTVAALGIVIMFVLMTILVIFSSFARSTSAALGPMALALAWASVLLTVATAFFIFTGFFFAWPRPLDQTAAQITERLGGPAPTPTPTPTAAPGTRTLSYSILVCRYRTDPQCQKTFTLSREIIFEEGYKIRLNVSSPRPGYLYVINEGPVTSGGLPEYVFLFPTRRVNGGSARIDPDQILTFPSDSWLRFDAQEGKEKLWLVWSAEAAGDLEAVARSVFLRTEEDQGAIITTADIVAVRDALGRYSATRPEVRKLEHLGRTDIEGHSATFAYAVVLEHH